MIRIVNTDVWARNRAISDPRNQGVDFLGVWSEGDVFHHNSFSLDCRNRYPMFVGGVTPALLAIRRTLLERENWHV